MDRKKLQLRNHPKLGSSTKVEPIREIYSIQKIKDLNAENLRNLCLFTMGINTAYRANELLSFSIGQVRHLKAGDRLDLKQSKNKKYRATTLNQTVITAIHNWIEVHPNPNQNVPLFLSTRGMNKALGVSAFSRLVKKWCIDTGLHGRFGSHTLRKTWGFQQRMQNNAPLPLLTRAYGHSTEEQTLNYLCIQNSEIEELFELEL